MRLIIIRHGETDRNAAQVTLGQDDVPLNDRGMLQANALAAWLGAPPFGNDIVAFYSSPLQRAVATATPLADALGLEVRTEPGLIEMDVGEVEGLPFPEMRERYPDFLRRWLSDDVADVSMPGGETLGRVAERGWAVVEALRERHAEETVALVSHNFVILTLLCRVLDLPLARFRRLRHDLAAVSIAELTPQRPMLVLLNDRSHLRAAGLSTQPSRRD